MNILKRIIVLLLSCFVMPLMAEPIDPSLISKISIATAAPEQSLSNHPFSEVVAQNLINSVSAHIDKNLKITVFGETQNWSSLSGLPQSTEGADETSTHLLRFSLSASQFTLGTLKVEGAESASLYLNNSPISGKNEFQLELMNQDYRALLIVSGVKNWQDFSVDWEYDEKSAEQSLVFGNDKSNKRASMKQYFDSASIGTLNISPDGELLIWSKTTYSDEGGDAANTVFEIIDLDSKDVVYRWQAMNPRQATWRKDSKALVFMHDNKLFELNRGTWNMRTLAENVEGIRSIDYVGNSSLLVSWHKDEEAESSITKHYRALEDRWSYWRGNAQLHLLDIDSGLFKQVSHHKLSTNLLDIDAQNQQVLIVRNPIDYAQPPHSLSQLSRLDLNTGEESILGEYRFFNGAYFHPEGIIILAGPDFAGDIGYAVSDGGLANNYDGQLYLINDEGKISSLSETFAPSISSVNIIKNGDMLLSTTDQDKTQLYRYDFSRSAFSLVETKVEVVSGFTLSQQSKPVLVYKGSSATKPESAHLSALGSKKDSVLFDSSLENFMNVDFATLKDWDYTTEDGQLIDGRVYYPPNFDDSKQYPALIYYYGGTAPVSRSFTGRWPFSLWASHGYIVYVLQPSGTIGYGQDFSARHVNAWGQYTAEDIIESTRAFVKAHPFVDETKLGNLGASYGGFMTMHLATKTDMFAASISHAGISNLTSYWGYGWWGYGYSGIATTGSFPWNRKDIYIEQSPVFAADKVSTPILLVHGDADTNVPVGESHQFYTALMLLNKDVELIEFLGDDHHINQRERRFKWWQTKLAYFDMKLKGQPLWWNTLYVEKH